jgi:thymidylate kinase
LAAAEPERIVVVDAAAGLEAVVAASVAEVLRRW